MDLSNTIIPKSDQLNADDLISGPRTIKITAVKSGNAEQPVSIHYHGDDGRPYKPGKSMRRVLVAMWGKDGNAYVGQSLTLYREPSITFGKDVVGGIRISHATGITQPLVIALTEKRGSRKPFRVEPMQAEKSAPSPAPKESTQTQQPQLSVAELDEAVFAAEQIGPERARKGTVALRDWFAALPAAVKTAVKPKLDAEWKPLAADCDGGKEDAS